MSRKRPQLTTKAFHLGKISSFFPVCAKDMHNTVSSHYTAVKTLQSETYLQSQKMYNFANFVGAFMEDRETCCQSYNHL